MSSVRRACEREVVSGHFCLRPKPWALALTMLAPQGQIIRSEDDDQIDGVHGVASIASVPR